MTTTLTYEQKLKEIRAQHVKEHKHLYYIKNRERYIAYSREYSKTYQRSEVQIRKYRNTENEKYRNDPVFREKAKARSLRNHRKKKVRKILTILESIITKKLCQQ